MWCEVSRETNKEGLRGGCTVDAVSSAPTPIKSCHDRSREDLAEVARGARQRGVLLHSFVSGGATTQLSCFGNRIETLKDYKGLFCPTVQPQILGKERRENDQEDVP